METNKKITNILILIFILGVFSFPSFSFAASSEKSIIHFAFFGLNPPVEGVIDDIGKAVALTVPTGTNITSLVPTIIVSPHATVSPASGVAKDFTNGVTYTVTAEDGSTQDYTAVVFVANNIPPGISITMKDLTDTSVTFLGTGFPQNKDVTFNVFNYDSGTQNYSDSQDYMTDSTGIVLYQFYGLSPGGHYKYSHSEAPGTGSFYTTGTPPPSGGGGGGNNIPRASTPLVTCTTDCGFTELMDMINRVINFILFALALPIAAIMFAYAGLMLVISGGEAGKRTKAKDIFLNVVIGLVIAVACWLIVHTILNIVGYDGSWIGL